MIGRTFASSTATLDADPLELATTIGTSEQSLSTGRVLLVSAETMTPELPEAFEAALRRHLSDTPLGTVTCRYTADGSGWIVFQSLGPQMTAITLEHADVVTAGRPIKWPASDPTLNFSCQATAGTVLVSHHGIIGKRIEPRPGLLSSTDARLGVFGFIESKLAKAVAAAQHEWFEDGIESQFVRALTALVHTYGDAAISALEVLLGSPHTNVEVAVEAAEWLGEVAHPGSHRHRRNLLEKVLLTASNSARLRHGAAAGLAAMNDRSSIPAVAEAREREGNRRLRQFLELVGDQLERTRACRSS